MILLGHGYVRTEFCSAVVTLLGQSVRTRFCSDRILFGHGHSARAECSDTILFGQNSVRPLSLCSGRVFGHDSVRTEFCSATVTLLGQSVWTRFCSDRTLFGQGHSARTECSDGILFGRCHSVPAECSDTIMFGHNSVRPLSLCLGRVFGHDSVREGFCSDRTLFGQGHSARTECSDGILFGQNSVRPLSLCSGRVFGHDSIWTEFCSAVVILLGQSVQTRFCSDRILFGHGHSARAECSDTILFGQNSLRPGSLCSDRVFGRDSVRTEFYSATVTLLRQSVRTRFCSAVVTLLRQSVRTRFCSGRILFGYGHSVPAECSDTILLGKDSVRPLPWFPPRVSFFIDVFEQELRIFKFLYSSACDTCVVDEPLRFPRNENMSETSASVSSSEESSSSSSSERVLTSGSEVGTSNPQLPQASTFQPLTSQPLPPSSSQPSHSLSRKNALGDVKDQADDKANPKPWYTADEKSGKMSTEDLQDLIREYPLPEGWYARLPGLQEPANYGTKFETGIYEEQVKSGYRLPLHPFALRFFEHYRMAPGQLVPNGWRKLAGLIYLVQTSGYKPDATDFMECFSKSVSSRGSPTAQDDEPLSEEQLEWAKIIPPKPIPAGLQIPSPPLAIPSMSSAETVPVILIPVLISTLIAEMASRSGKSPQGGFLGVLQKAKGKRKEKQPSVELPPVPKRTRVTPPERSPRILEQVSIDDDPIFRPRWTLRCDDLGMPDSHVSEQHLLHGILPRDKEVFQTQTHETFACSFAQAVYTMYASGSEMFSRFEMARQVAADEAQQKREAVKEAQEASHRAEELSKQEADHLAQIATLEKRLERVKRKAAEEVTKARDQGIRDFLDGNAGDEWLKKCADDGLEIYELGFAKAKEMFAERFPDILLDDFVLPAVISPSGETVLPSEAGDAAASHPPGEGPSGDAPEP
ncbi:hypothetical protein RJ639_020674 [Escallonia herrerae]|uniref:Transposase (putative) gypsy type domain-containing protein n=1 Tax=Escallonia herrerae TaxID=1293975 RepID=A0AA88V5A4_9ASTE|nr:hypothetical protein RJ639_020674 [Escallonia herrerae]